MKKQIFTILMFALTFVSVQAQDGEPVVQKGDFILNAGVGYLSPFGYYYGTGLSANRLPAFQLSGEYIGWDISDIGLSIGVGGTVGYQRAFYKNSGYKWAANDIFTGPRGSLHFGQALKLKKGDLYAGLQVGLRVTTYSDNANANYDSNIYFYRSFFLGARYFFAPKFGIFAEAGYDITWLKGGVTMKF